MLKRIWIPDWMYQWIPRSAMLIGLIGAVLSGLSFGWLILSMLTFWYGVMVLMARSAPEMGS